MRPSGVYRSSRPDRDGLFRCWPRVIGWVEHHFASSISDSSPFPLSRLSRRSVSRRLSALRPPPQGVHHPPAERLHVLGSASVVVLGEGRMEPVYVGEGGHGLLEPLDRYDAPAESRTSDLGMDPWVDQQKGPAEVEFWISGLSPFLLSLGSSEGRAIFSCRRPNPCCRSA